MKGKEPPVTTTNVFGCSVKWADKVPDYANYKKKWAAEPVTLEKADAAGIAWDDDLSAFTVRTAIEQADDDLFSDDDLGTVATRQAADADDLEFEADEEEVARQPISI